MQALQEGTANIELQIDPQGNGHWTTVSTVVFTALDTNVGSSNGVQVTPAGYLTIINDVLGVGSDVYMNSAQQANTQLTPNPNAAIGLPAHLVLTGNGVAVIQNDEIDIWDYYNKVRHVLRGPCHGLLFGGPGLGARAAKPQEQGTMVYDQGNNTFVQTLPDGTVRTFSAPDPDENETTSPDDFGLLTTSVDVYGNTTNYLLSRRWHRAGRRAAYQPDLDGRPVAHLQRRKQSSFAGTDRLRNRRERQLQRDRDAGLRGRHRYDGDGIAKGDRRSSSRNRRGGRARRRLLVYGRRGGRDGRKRRLHLRRGRQQPGLIETFNAEDDLSGATYYGYSGNLVQNVLTTDSIGDFWRPKARASPATIPRRTPQVY